MKKPGKTECYIWHALPIAALILWGALCMTDQLWYDEAYSVGLVMQPWKKMVYITAVDAHSPFYYSLLKIYYLILGGGTHFAKLKFFSLFFMMGYMCLGKYYVKKLFGRRISVWFMLSSLMMPIMSVQAGNVRMYAMALFFMTLSGLMAYDLFLNDGKKWKWTVFCLAGICTVYCHTFAMIQEMWLYIIFMVALLRTKQYSKLKKCFLCGMGVAVVFSPWLFVTFKQIQMRMNYTEGIKVEYATVHSFMDYCVEWFSAFESPVGPVVFLGMAVAVVLGYLAVDRVRGEKSYGPALGMAAFGLTVLTGGVVSAYINNCFLGRYVFPGFGFLMLFYAFGLEQLRSRPLRACVLGAMLCSFVLQYRLELKLEYDGGLQRYKAFVEEYVEKDDVVLAPYVHNVFLGVYYPELQYRLDGYVAAKIPFPNLEACYNVGELLENNTVWYISPAQETPDELTDRYEKMLDLHYMYYDFTIYRLN